MNERNQTKTKNKFITIHLCFNSILSILFCLLNNSLIVSLWSIAKAPLCLRSPSIITSTHYRSIHHSSLWCSCLSFNLLESGLRPAMVSPDNEVLPNWVSKILFLLPVILLNLYSIKNSISTIYVSSYTCHALYIVSSNDQLCFVIVRITHTKNIAFYSCKKTNLSSQRVNYKNLFVIESILEFETFDSDQSITKNLWHSPLNVQNYYIKNHSCWMFKLLTRDGDVEKNPGPEEITMVTLNCRGLKNEGKLKQLLNRLTTTHNIYSNLIITLQETHLDYNSLKYRWKGNHIFTPSLSSI